MPLDPAPSLGPGGLLYLEYTDATINERHSIRLHLAHFDPTPHGPDNDYLYDGAGPHVPAEASVLGTAATLCALLAPYYRPTWLFRIVSVWYNAGGVLTELPVVPTFSPVAGTNMAAPTDAPAIKRTFTLRDTGGAVRRLYLSQLPGAEVGVTETVTSTTGGFDVRDRALMGYLGGGESGIVARDGRPFRGLARVRNWWARNPEPDTSGTVGPAGADGLPGPPGPPGADAILPFGVTGDLLVNIGGTWVRLPGGALDQRLTMALHGSVALPTWLDDCCKDAGKVITPLPPSDQTMNAERCGAAVQMATYLELYYSKIRTLLNAAGTVALVLTLPVLADLIAGAAPTLLVTGTLLSVRQIIRLVIGLGLAGLRLSVAPVLTTEMRTAVRQAIYCALPVPPAPLEVTDDVRAHWCSALMANSVFTPLSGPILALLSEIVSLAGWQTLANLGAQTPQTICATCGAGAAMQGGAQFGVGLTRAMQGGAEYGVRLTRAMQGGAQLDTSLTGATQGGALTP